MLKVTIGLLLLLAFSVPVVGDENEINSKGDVLLSEAGAGGGELRVVGYFGGNPQRYERLTHIIPRFGGAEADGTIHKADLRRAAAEAHAHGVKCIISFESGNTPFSKIVDNADGSRDRFISNLLDYLLKNDLDGVDFDWEIGGGFPEKERDNYSLLIRDLRKVLAPRDLTISIDAMYREELNSIGIANVDWIQLMSYQDFQQGIDMLEYWERLGAPREKLLLGMSSGWAVPEWAGKYGFDTDLAAAKAQYVLNNGYGGLMLFRTDIDAQDEKSMLGAADEILTKRAKLATPTIEQMRWQDMEMGAMICIGLETWQDKESDDETSMENLKLFNPSSLDTDQWVRAVEAFGGKYIVFVAKHVGGFCLWQTDSTEYSIKNSPYKNGKGDILAELAQSCRRRGMKLGIYIYPGSLFHGAAISAGGKTRDPARQKEYDRIYRQQLTEVLSQYGEMMEVWFDGSVTIAVKDILDKYARDAMVFQGPQATIRWVGNERGYAPYPAWNAVNSDDPAVKAGHSTARHGDPDGDRWLPNEVDTTIRDHYWFWSTTNEKNLKSLDKLVDIYYNSVGHGQVLLLNVNPDRRGLVPEADLERYTEFGNEIRRRFEKNIAQTKGSGNTVELDLKRPTAIDHVITTEEILFGERVREYVIEEFTDGNWRKIAGGTAIGHKKIDSLDRIKVSKVRLRVLNSAAKPVIRKLAVYDRTKQTQPKPLAFETIKTFSEGPAEGQQGITTDGTYIYVQSDRLYKFDMDGNLIAKSKPTGLHGGGITYFGEKIYVAVSQCYVQGSDKHFVYAYDTTTLKKVAEYDISEYFGVCAGGIAVHSDHFYVGESYWDDNHYDYIVKFDRIFNFVESYKVYHKSTAGIQGLTYLKPSGKFLVNSHGRGFYRIDVDFDMSKLEPGIAPFELQDAEAVDASTVLLNNRSGGKIVFARIISPQ